MKLCRSVILYAESVIFQGPQMRLEIGAISGDISDEQGPAGPPGGGGGKNN